VSEPSANRVELTGQLIEISALRHTPAGVPVLSFTIRHRSQQFEAGLPREVNLEAPGIAMGTPANLLAGARPGLQVRVSGFLAAKSLRNQQPVLRVNTIEFLEGTKDGL
jgi:primosomal replication protein N